MNVKTVAGAVAFGLGAAVLAVAPAQAAPTGMADLQVQMECAKWDQQTGVVVTVRNNGSAPAREVHTEYSYVFAPTGNQYEPALAPGESRRYFAGPAMLFAFGDAQVTTVSADPNLRDNETVVPVLCPLF